MSNKEKNLKYYGENFGCESDKPHRESDFLQTEEENEIAMTIFGPFQADGSVNAHILRWAHV